MSYKSCFSFSLLLLTTLLFGLRISNACSCAPKPTVLDDYEGSDVVIIARAVAVEKSADGKGINGVAGTRMVIEKVFKGKFKVGDEITMQQGGGRDCLWTFNEGDVNEQYLFYLNSIETDPNFWVASGCRRSNRLQDATDDLLYLNKMEKVRGKTRISGTLEFEGNTDLSVAARTIRIIGTNKSYEVKTDRNGVYEIYDLPAGKYLIEPEIPLGWKIDPYSLSQSSSFAGKEDDDRSPKKIPITLEAKKQAGLDIRFEIDNAIRGRVYDPGGKPMRGVCINALLAQSEKEGEYRAGCTDENGNFAITEIPRGSYILAVNNLGKISSNEPFKTFYYPDVSEREKATVFTIGEGTFLDSINIYVPKVEETVTVEGVLLYSDGKPAADVSVDFKATTVSVEFKSRAGKEDVSADAHARTDAQGRFSIKILKGLKGKLYGSMYTYSGEFENCPKLEAIIKESGNTSAEVKTAEVEIQAENNLYNLELKYTFPSCRKAKVPDEDSDSNR